MYDEITQLYHLIYDDWDLSIDLQATQLHQAIRTVWGDSIRSILDVTCGMGTQSIGLAQQGFRLTGSDLSANLVARANHEARLRDLNIDFTVCDVRKAAAHHGGGFDLVISCDNSLAANCSQATDATDTRS